MRKILLSFIAALLLTSPIIPLFAKLPDNVPGASELDDAKNSCEVEVEEAECHPEIKDNYLRMIACLQPEREEDSEEEKSCKDDLQEKAEIVQKLGEQVETDKANADQWLKDARAAAEGAEGGSQAEQSLKQAEENFAAANRAYDEFQTAKEEGDVLKMYDAADRMHTATQDGGLATDVLEGGGRSKLAGTADPISEYVNPVTGEMGGRTSQWCYDCRGRGSTGGHAGVDIDAPLGTPVVSAADGEVVSRRFSNGYGVILDIEDENGYIHRYAHIDPDANIQPGDTVTAGQRIGVISGAETNVGKLVEKYNGDYAAAQREYEATKGVTPPHLHYEVRESEAYSRTQFGMSGTVDPATLNANMHKGNHMHEGDSATPGSNSSDLIASIPPPVPVDTIDRTQIALVNNDDYDTPTTITAANSVTSDIVRDALSIPKDSPAYAEAEKNALAAISKSHELSNATSESTRANLAKEIENIALDTQQLAKSAGVTPGSGSYRFTASDCDARCRNNLGVRMNNPTNLQNLTEWVGLVENQDHLTNSAEPVVKFAEPEWGIRAAFEDIETKQSRGEATTLASLANVWVEKGKLTQAKLDTMVSVSGLSLNEKFDISDPEVGPAVIKALIVSEVGSGFYSDQQILDGYNLAWNFDDNDVAGMNAYMDKIKGSSPNAGSVVSTDPNRGGTGTVVAGRNQSGSSVLSTNPSGVTPLGSNSGFSGSSGGSGGGMSGMIQNLASGLLNSIGSLISQGMTGGGGNPFAPQAPNPGADLPACPPKKIICPSGPFSCRMETDQERMQRCTTGMLDFSDTAKQGTDLISGILQNIMGGDASSGLFGKLSGAIGGGLGDIFGSGGGMIGNLFNSIFSRAGEALGSLFSGGFGGGGGGGTSPFVGSDGYAEGTYNTYSEGSYVIHLDDVESDLTVTALRAEETITNEYRFRGTLSRDLADRRDNLSFSEISEKFGSTIENELLLDLDCDGGIDDALEFSTPYRAVLPRSGGTEVLLSEYMEVPRSGLHCFAFAVDINDDLEETNENNNASVWREFIPGFGGDIEDLPSDTSLPVFTFEVKVTDDSGNNVTDWQTGDVSIESDEELAFRWNAPDYDSCLPFIFPADYIFDEDALSTDRDTEAEQIDVRELSRTYAVQCRLGDDTRVEMVGVNIFSPGDTRPGCYDDGIYRPIDYRTSSYVNEDGWGQRIDDATFVCTEDGWAVEGSDWGPSSIPLAQ